MHPAAPAIPSAQAHPAPPVARATHPKRILWAYALPIVLLHLLALVAVLPWLFSWTGLVAMVVGIHVYGQAITLCYHRMLSHRSFRVPRWLEKTFVYLALCCLQDTPARWVATHRMHHNHSDEEPDPHTPLAGAVWSHVGWLMFHDPDTHNSAAYHKYAKDLLADPFYMRMEKNPWVVFYVYVAHALLYFAAGLGAGYWADGTVMAGVQLGLSLLVWGVVVRTVLVWHITWSVNSLTHMWGYRNHETGEKSRNNWLVALLSVGEGWHNNHHADPSSAGVQHRWWEVDISYYQIKLLEKLGLATRVRPPMHKRRSAADTAIPADE